MAKFERYFFSKMKELFDKNNFEDDIIVWKDNGINVIMKINKDVYFFETTNYKILILKSELNGSMSNLMEDCENSKSERQTSGKSLKKKFKKCLIRE